jgi:hypothetical protein
MGFFVSPDGRPPVDTLALQSFKEPPSWTASFEDDLPSLGFWSSRRERLSDLPGDALAEAAATTESEDAGSLLRVQQVAVDFVSVL